MKDIIIVEGVHDEIKLKSVFPNCECVVTNGSEISKDTILYIKKLSLTHKIIIFTDPDYPGERIRNIILSEVPNASLAFLRKKDCISSNRKKVGIEHASKEAIIEALENVYTPTADKDTITMNDIYKLGLNGSPNSSYLRDRISEYLNIGKPNSKTFLKRLNLLQIDYETLKDIICKVK